jgi:hypothetical protein
VPPSTSSCAGVTFKLDMVDLLSAMAFAAMG